MPSYLPYIEYLLTDIGCRKGMKSDHMVLFASGLGLTIISFLFIFPYVGLYTQKLFENLTTMPMEVPGLHPQNLLYSCVFAVLFVCGLGLLAKGFI
jgi:hypothetical protein